MIKSVDIETFLKERSTTPVIDVRSPVEFSKGHIPGAINIPLFTDEQRAEVGIKYKRASRANAIILGLELAGPNLHIICKRAKKLAGINKNVLIYCFRGGMRSNSIAWLINQTDINCMVLKGGYKAYRKKVHSTFEKEMNLSLLTGLTGSGKTEILNEINKLGEQVIDLEGLANHKGSAFGALGNELQPTTEKFENFLFEKLKKLDLNKNIWLEDESRSIGSVILPESFFNQMRKSIVIKIDLNKNFRINRLLRDYTNFDKSLLIDLVKKIEKRLGGKDTLETIEAIKQDNFKKAIDITLSYYDKAYSFNLKRREIEKQTTSLRLEKDNPKENALLITGALKKDSTLGKCKVN